MLTKINFSKQFNCMYIQTKTVNLCQFKGCLITTMTSEISNQAMFLFIYISFITDATFITGKDVNSLGP